MKNKLFIGIITFFSTIILIVLSLNFFDSDSKKIFSFNRKFDTIYKPLKFEKKFQKLGDEEFLMFINSDSFLVERTKKNIDSINDFYKFYLADFDFKTKLNLIVRKHS